MSSFISMKGYSQDQIIFKDALIIKAPPGYLETIGAKDPIEASIVFGKWKTPKRGETIQYNDTTKGVWKTSQPDEKGWFNDSLLQGAYVYFSYISSRKEVLLLEGMGHSMVYVNGSPRSGNPYAYKEDYESWEPKFNYSLIPVMMEKGTNEFLFQCNRGILKAKLSKPRAGVMLNINDLTSPDLIAAEKFDCWAALVVINATSEPKNDLKIKATYLNGIEEITPIPPLQPLCIKKIGFKLKGLAPKEIGNIPVRLSIMRNNEQLDTATIVLRVVNATDNHKETFISSIDGSVQYYSINPARSTDNTKPLALFFSLHGAGVEAINQTGSYYPKTWGHIVSPTNRRPYGFNWEDWGRSDALEVLDIVKKKLNIDESRIYLTGHSMGGHGAYHLGVTFPDKFAAVAPSAGWISFWSYRVREKFDHPSPIRQMLMRATLPSDTYTLAQNLQQVGVYILHGSQDDNVLPDQSRMMAEHLKTFHKDFIYHEEEGAGHWWDHSDEAGTDCVDYAPMFDFFARHARPEEERIRQIHFVTSSPGISSRNNWLSIEAQREQLKLSTVNIEFDPGVHRFIGTTKNVQRLSIDLTQLKLDDSVRFELDNQKIGKVDLQAAGKKICLEQKGGEWKFTPEPSPLLKGPRRYGTFKDIISNNVQFVYGTHGTDEENKWAFEKARFDAERFWYQGNGSIDLIADIDFDAGAEPDRNILLYGNAKTNTAWKSLLADSPVQVGKGVLTIGQRTFHGDDLNCLFIRPRQGSGIACIGAVSGTGIAGMRLNNKMSYLMPGIAFPDCMAARADMLIKGEKEILAAGFFGLDWSVESGEFEWQEK